MPRRLQGKTGGLIFHVMNRGVRKLPLFTGTGDYEAFFQILREAAERVAVRVLAIALMPNHWHLVLWPRADGDLTRYVGWVSLTHACRWQRVHETRGTGPVYQGRFRGIPIQTGIHLLTALRYVERNPVRARLVARADEWPWSSASDLAGALRPTLHDWPIPRPPEWLELLNEPEPAVALAVLRECVTRSAPYGTEEWRNETALRLGWTTGLRSPGRPYRDACGTGRRRQPLREWLLHTPEAQAVGEDGDRRE